MRQTLWTTATFNASYHRTRA